MSNFEQMLTVQKNGNPHELRYDWSLDQKDLDTHESQLLDYGDNVTLAEAVDKIDHFCPTISMTKEAITALMEKDIVAIIPDR